MSEGKLQNNHKLKYIYLKMDKYYKYQLKRSKSNRHSHENKQTKTSIEGDILGLCKRCGIDITEPREYAKMICSHCEVYP